MLKIFPQYEKVVAAFSDKSDGSLSSKWPAENVERNRQLFLQKLGLDTNKLQLMEQVHRGDSFVVAETTQVKTIPGVDALVTQQKEIILGVETADCVPVFAYNPITEMIGVAHAGWRGIEAGVVESLVGNFAERGNLLIYVGPHIQSCCFEVKNDVQEKFAKYPQAFRLDFGAFYISLSLVIKEKLLALGLREENIQISNDCTCCGDKYFSYRRDKGNNPGAMLGIITLL